MINNAAIYKEIVTLISKPTLLWENPVPTDWLNAFEVELNGVGYDGYIIESKYSAGTSAGLRAYNVVKMGENGCVRCGASNNGATSGRGVTNVSETSISFTAGYSTTHNLSAQYAIPLRIWGFKFTL